MDSFLKSEKIFDGNFCKRSIGRALSFYTYLTCIDPSFKRELYQEIHTCQSFHEEVHNFLAFHSLSTCNEVNIVHFKLSLDLINISGGEIRNGTIELLAVINDVLPYIDECCTIQLSSLKTRIRSKLEYLTTCC